MNDDPLALGTDDDDATALELARQMRKEQERLEVGDWQWLMKGVRGRRIAWRILARAGVNRQSFTNDPIQTAFNEGFRSYGTVLLDQIMTHAPDKYVAMFEENALGKRTDSK